MSIIQQREKLLQWMAALNTLQSEINTLKTNLTFTLQQEVHPALLQSIESIQTQLLEQDMAIALIRHEMAIRMGAEEPAAEDGSFDEWEQKTGHDMERMNEELLLLHAALEMVHNDYQEHE